jgi:hypothetical protein
MKRLIFTTVVGGALLASSQFASAILYVDNNPANVRLDADYLGGLNPFYNPSYDGQFNLTGYGFNPTLQQIDHAVVTFTLGDLFGSETYNISIESDSLFSGGSFTGLINLGSDITGSLLADLNADGILNYTVSTTRGSFWLLNANLTAEASNFQSIPTADVPDGGTSVALLGLGLLALAFVRTKLVAG